MQNIENSDKAWVNYMFIISIPYVIGKIGLVVRIFFYRGSFRKQLSLYGIAEMVPLIFQLLMIPMSLLVVSLDYSYITNAIPYLYLIPSIALFMLFYNALKLPNFQEEKGSSSPLDGGEFFNY
jgi:hypothetical protein